MLEALAYLHDSELVAGFQRRCGLFLVEAAHRTRGVARAGTPNHIDQSGGLQKTTWSHQDSNCNYKYEENLVMYIGQVMKDVLKLPRPLSPPVVKLETRVDAEYGLPSTHAMAATAISFTLLLSAPSRIQFQFEVGLLMAVTLSTMVCLSRLYTGMHSVLDVICGVLISALVLYVTYPFWESFEQFQLTSSISPMVALVLPLILSYTYPELEHYSTTRGDTTTILGVGAGCSVGYWINKQLGETFEPKGVLPVPLPTLTTHTLVLGTARFLVGVFALVGTRQVTKAVSLHLLYWWYNIPKSSKCATRRKEIEVPSKFATYTSVGIVHSFLVNRIFLLLGLV
ncbi:sphingosine-1-phosphate phosphatase 2 isoform X3 [Dunckerocampus dactyliophorus]|uniref:sphingosine-1-phosphate phosphatase 2 isoform X3 n=1 Tax=Dunckerocampus dactyliophorus TaxID=161453 RepID=UPI0024067B5C|nr:sphingosine-1-phosphate phosphatase 2 isoform X3 [Dunckerocampus dactyliophorus]